MADTSLIFNIIARDKTTATLEKIKKNAGSAGSVMAKALGPAVAPVLAVATGGVLALGSAFAAAGAGAGVFGAVAASTMTEITEVATKYDDLTKKIELYGKEAQLQAARGEDNSKTLKKQAAAQLELEARLKMLPKAQRDATEGYLDMKDAWTAFVDKNKPATYGIFAQGFNLMSSAIDHLQPYFDAGAAAAKRLLDSITPLVSGGGLDTLGQRAGPALMSLTNIIINIGKAVGRSFGAFATDGQGMLAWLEKATAKWAEFSNVKTGGGLQKFVDYFRTNGPQVVLLLTNLASAAVNIAQAVSPLAPISMAVATALSAIIAAVPPEVITALVAGWIAFGIAVKAYAAYGAIMTAVQWAQNAALFASPLTWVALAVVALIAVIVLLATKTKFFQTAWSNAQQSLKDIGAWFAGPFANFFVRGWQMVVNKFNSARNTVVIVIGVVMTIINRMRTTFNNVVVAIVGGVGRFVQVINGIPGRIRGALSNMWTGLWNGFRNVMNKIIGGWNRLSFGIPGFSFAGMSFGGMNVGTPNIPYMATGGDIKSDGLIYGHAGERVTKAAQVTRTGPGAGSGGGGGGATITIEGSNAKVIRVLLELLREGIRDQGGDPVRVLTAK